MFLCSLCLDDCTADRISGYRDPGVRSWPVPHVQRLKRWAVCTGNQCSRLTLAPQFTLSYHLNTNLSENDYVSKNCAVWVALHQINPEDIKHSSIIYSKQQACKYRNRQSTTSFILYRAFKHPWMFTAVCYSHPNRVSTSENGSSCDKQGIQSPSLDTTLGTNSGKSDIS